MVEREFSCRHLPNDPDTTGDRSTHIGIQSGDMLERCTDGVLQSTTEVSSSPHFQVASQLTTVTEAPQYPFPCAVQDCLAAYLYLVKPPPDAKHRPVHPKNIIIGGDSAGGGLVLALLQILRDTEGLELPAGAVLISPVCGRGIGRGLVDYAQWSDMTHSFPSLLKNTATVGLQLLGGNWLIRSL